MALSHCSLSLLIRGLTSTFAADEGASPLLKFAQCIPDGDGALIFDLAITFPVFEILVNGIESEICVKPAA